VSQVLHEFAESLHFSVLNPFDTIGNDECMIEKMMVPVLTSNLSARSRKLARIEQRRP
jgi:hypothetical protein